MSGHVETLVGTLQESLRKASPATLETAAQIAASGVPHALHSALRRIETSLTERDAEMVLRALDVGAQGGGGAGDSLAAVLAALSSEGDGRRLLHGSFFWGKRAGLLSRADRLALATKLGESKRPSRPKAELMAILRERVHKSGAKQVFEHLDLCHRGHLNGTDVAEAMRKSQIDLTLEEANQLIAEINRHSGIALQQHLILTYPAFAKVFEMPGLTYPGATRHAATQPPRTPPSLRSSPPPL